MGMGALLCSWASSMRLTLRPADITNAYFPAKPLEPLIIPRVPRHPKGVPEAEISSFGF